MIITMIIVIISIISIMTITPSIATSMLSNHYDDHYHCFGVQGCGV